MKTQNFNMDRERVTGATRVIMSDHANIHDGEGYNASVYAEGVADNAYVQIEFKTPEAPYIHMKSITVNSEGLGLFEVLEAPTLTTGNTAIVTRNLRRVAPVTVSGAVLKSDPTSISAGTLIRSYFTGAGKDTGGPTNLDTEIVLERNTTYLFRVQNLGGSAKALSLYLFWYEEDGA